MDFVIAAPPYSSRSGGIMVLHELCTELNKLNYRAGIAFITEGSQQHQGFKFGYSNAPEFLDPQGTYHDFTSDKTTEEIGEFIRNACIIYPDIVKGNPLGGKTFATYVLGRPTFPIESDFIIGFSKLYIDHPDYLLFKPFISDCMHARDTLHWSQRKLNLTYIGKGASYLECSIIPGSVLIERDWPKDKVQLAALLRNCKYFFSWDTVSATNTDAALCGAVPVLMHDLQIPRSEINFAEHGPFPNVSYEPGLQDRLPSDLALVDAAILGIQKNLNGFLESWPERVSGLAETISSRQAVK